MKGQTQQSVKDYLLPQPKKIEITGTLKVNLSSRIITQNLVEPGVIQSASRVHKVLSDVSFCDSFSENSIFNKTVDLELKVDYSINKRQGYIIDIKNNGILISGNDAEGLWNGVLTFEQLSSYAQENGGYPQLKITDWPDFERRGVMLDISRDKVPTMKTLYNLIDQLSKWKINEFQLYTEHTFAYQNHKKVWENASPMTADQVVELDTYCKERFIDLVPNQNSFGHMHRWLKHDEYLHLAECPTPAKTIWGMMSKTSLSPVEPGSIKLVEELFNELLPNFSSEYVNIGCDETVELGCGKSKDLCKKVGKGKVYLDFLLKLKKIIDANGKKVQFWGDIILHHPELIPELPKDMTALIWGYTANHPFKRQCAQFQKSGLDFYVCPGTSTWKTIMGRNKNGFDNLLNAAENGKTYGAKGFLNTNWGDNGHWQPQSVCYPAYLYGAALSWSVKENKSIDVAHFLNQQVFKDRNNAIGQLIVDLGNAYLETGVETDNSNIFFHMLKEAHKPMAKGRNIKKLKVEKVKHAMAFIEQKLQAINNTSMQCDDAQLVKDEMEQAAKLCLHACQQVLYKMQAKGGSIKNITAPQREELKAELEALIIRHKKLWIKRNRTGGVGDSSEKLRKILRMY